MEFVECVDKVRSSAASSSVPSSNARTARRTTSPADTPRARAFASRAARSSGDIRTINLAVAGTLFAEQSICGKSGAADKWILAFRRDDDE
jgi:hypothetical protein